MSDDENVHSDDEGTGPTEAERAMQKRRAGGGVLDEDAQDLLDTNKKMRDQMGAEIEEMRKRSEQRKAEREEEDKASAARRNEEENRRKAEEEERKRKKDEEDQSRRAKRAEKMAEFDKMKNPSKPNFVITKKEGGGVSVGTEGEDSGAEKKSKEQVEAEKKAILAQRVQPLNVDGFDMGKLTEKAKDLHQLVFRLESEKYDLEKRFKEQQYDMMELAERARQMNRVGKGGLKRIQLGVDEVDKIQERFAGAPAKIVMVGKFDRTFDSRTYGEKSTLFHGPAIGEAAARVNPKKTVKWDQSSGLPQYEYLPGFSADDDEEEGEAEAEEE